MEPNSTEKQWIELADGGTFPAIGYGTFQLREVEETASAVRAAVAAGYRLIDTAANYGNEEGVGEGVRSCDQPRSEILVSSKVWPEDLGYDRTRRSFEESLERLGLEYMDLFLIHWPCSDELNLASWKAMEQLRTEGLVRNIGVSNFTAAHLEKLLAEASVPPLVNQVEFHPRFHDEDIHRYCSEKGIVVEAWSPLMQGGAFKDETLLRIGRKHGREAAQVALRWCVQMGTVPLPKTRTPSRMAENISIFDFALDDEDMAAIGKLRTGQRFGPDPVSYQFCPVKP
jgi:2,5-diketo-D-gluconate reductase A